jgi:D-amino-acid dehydrogenase
LSNQNLENVKDSMEKHSEVLVIGGGIIGLACAYYLAHEGKSVRIVEQDRIGAGASHGNCGLIFTSHLLPLCAPGTIGHEIKRMLRRTSPLYIRFAPDIRRLKWFLRFAKKCNPRHMAHAIEAREKILQSSKSLFETLFRKEQLECDREQRGVLLVFKTQTAMQKYVQTNNQLKPYGFDADPLAGDALFRLEPALQNRQSPATR